jgi:NAD(P)-dependent dehydrogenase (short-subunit alcohol dehydrogenase family)
MSTAGIDSSDLDFSGKRVLVTGAASGIGSAIARAFSAHGATLLLADINRDGLDAIAQELPNSTAFTYNQSDSASIAALADAAGQVDVLMNNAGILSVGPILEASAADVDRVIRTNLIGPMQLILAIAPAMVSRGSGVIVNTASQLAFTGSATRAIYATAKAGLVQFTKAVAAELAPQGVRIVAIGPGRTRTPLTAHLLSDKKELAQSLRRIPAGRIGEAEEIARLALLLASPLADYIVGETLIADGGYILE